MFSYECALAALLLTAPAESAPDPKDAALLEWLRPAVVQAALDAELLDPREERFLSGQSRDAVGDLKELQARAEALAQAPPAAECQRFPDRKLINDLLAFNRAYRQHLDSRQSLDTTRAYELNEALREADRLYQVWDTVRDARCEFYYVTVRRQALKKLRETVGPQAYYSAALPPHVPVWRFTRID